MGVIDYLVRRKLDRYGLVVTADDRVMSTRTGDVVGWADGHEPVRPRPSIASAAEMMMVPQAVAVAPLVDEDEWEWEIAMARARAMAAEEMQAATVVTWPARVLSPAEKQLAVVRTQARRTPPPMRAVPRIAKGTRPPASNHHGDNETTVVTQAPVGDETSPYVTMPPEIKPVGRAHTRRVAAKVR